MSGWGSVAKAAAGRPAISGDAGIAPHGVADASASVDDGAKAADGSDATPHAGDLDNGVGSEGEDLQWVVAGGGDDDPGAAARLLDMAPCAFPDDLGGADDSVAESVSQVIPELPDTELPDGGPAGEPPMPPPAELPLPMSSLPPVPLPELAPPEPGPAPDVEEPPWP